MRVLEWDTQFFGVTIGRAELAEEPLAAAVEQARKAGVRCLVGTAPASRLDLVNDATAAGARLVDLRMELTAEEEWRGPRSGVRVAGGADEATLKELARRLSAFSRFRADPRFPAERVAAMYDVWAERCLREGAVAIAEDGSGFVGARPGEDRVRVDLVYVDPAASGRGVGGALVHCALEALGARRALVVTQAGNARALRLYERLGFRANAVDAMLHLWLDEAR